MAKKGESFVKYSEETKQTAVDLFEDSGLSYQFEADVWEYTSSSQVKSGENKRLAILLSDVPASGFAAWRKSAII